MAAVADIEHQRGIEHMLMHMFLVNAHKGRCPPHVPHGAVTVGTVFHQKGAGLQQQMQFLTDFSKGFIQNFILVVTQNIPILSYNM